MPSHITVTTDRYTAILGRNPHRPELYDRRNDPQQFKNIAEGNSELVEKLRAELVRFMWQQGADIEVPSFDSFAIHNARFTICRSDSYINID